MSETAELAAALAAAQAELPEVGKNRKADVKNKDGKYLYSYAYADLADVSAAVLPVLGRHGLAFTAFPGHQPDGKFGLRYYLLHASGASLEGFFEIDDKGGMQLVGGRITYARRYCLCAVTGITADEDVDARDDSHSRTVQRKPQRDSGSLQPQQAVQRRTQSPPPAPAAPHAGAVPPSAERAGGDLPPLPGEEEDPTTSGASSSARAPASASRQPGGAQSPSSSGGSARGPADRDAPGTVSPQQIKAIWTILGQVYHFGDDEKDQARGVCAQVVNRELASSKDMSKSEAAKVIDTLARWQNLAEAEGDDPRGYLLLMIQEGTAPREDGEPGE